MKNAIIIVAGGSGKRMGTEIPKQFLEICGKPIIFHTIYKFVRFDPDIHVVIVVNPDYMQIWEKLIKKISLPSSYNIVAGGETRFHSVKNGLMVLTNEVLVGIHDAVRPLIHVETIRKIYNHAADYGNAVPVIPVKESVRQVKGNSSKIIDRSSLKLIQTPQVFLLPIIKKAYETEYRPEFTDDASVVEYSGTDINLVEGDSYNIKITTREDLELANLLLG